MGRRIITRPVGRTQHRRRFHALRWGGALLVLIGVPLVLILRANAAITFRAAATGNNAGATSVSIGMPTGTVQNDVMIAVISVRGGTGTTITPPSGWNLINSNDSTTVLKSSTYYKVAGASESGPYSFGFSSSQKASGVISSYSGVNTTTPINANGSQVNASANFIYTPSIAPTMVGTTLILGYSTAAGGTLSGAGMLRGQTASTGGLANTQTTTGLADEDPGYGGDTGPRKADASVTAVNIGHAIALTPIITTFTQSAYRWYANADSVQPGSALAAENTSYSLPSVGTPVRLRMQQDISQLALGASGQAFALQYATSTSGPWHNVGVASWWNSSWGTRKKITLNNIGSTSNLANFPIRVSLSSSNIDYSKTQNSGQDIRFVDPDGTVLKHEIEKWDEAGTSEVWVKVPQIDALSNSDYIYMYYNNATASDGQDAANVWDSSYKAVWHSKESSGTSVADSTSNANTGSLNNGASLTTSGQIGNANSFDGINDVMNAGSPTSLDNLVAQGGGGMSVSAWVNSVDSDRWSQVATKAQSATPSNGWILEIADNSSDDSPQYGQTGDGGGSTLLHRGHYPDYTYNTWQYVAASYTGSTNIDDIKVYLNGILTYMSSQAGGFTTRDSDAPYDFTSGCDMPATDPDECLEGKIDELRVSNVVRSSDWLYAEYLSTSNAMNTFGSEESYTNLGTVTWYNNATPAHGAAITSTLLTGSDVLGSYQEQNPSPVNPNAISTGQQGEWDFALDFSSAVSATYYFRMVTASYAPMSTYTYYPTIVVTAGPTLDQQLRGGGSVINGTKGKLTW